MPSASRAAAPARDRLLRHGFRPTFAETTGSWRTDAETLRGVLQSLLHDGAFVRMLYRETAIGRRRLQEATALWSPVMLTSGAHTSWLSRFRELTDAFECLQERVRLSGLIGGLDRNGWDPDPVWLVRVVDQFVETVEKYHSIRDEFGNEGKLPSDAFVDRLPASRS
jgi:hypothetical protein